MAGIQKAFAIKNGLEVNQKLLVANSLTGRVGIGSSLPSYLLDVAGGIGVTDVYAVGFATFTNRLNVGANGSTLTALASGGVGVGTNTIVGSTALQVRGNTVITSGSVGIGNTNPTSSLDVVGNTKITGVTTVGSLSIGSTQVISSGQQLQNILSLDSVTTSTIEAAVANGPNTFTDLKVTGLSTFVGLATFNSGLQVISGITTLGVTTATNLTAQQLNISGLSTFVGVTTHTASLFGTSASFTGVVTASSFVGSGASLTGNARNLTATIGISTSGIPVGYGVSFLDLRGPGLSTVYYNSSVGIATIYLQGGGGSGSASIGIGSTPGDAFVGIITGGNLWYNTNYGRLFIYYQDADSAQWVDAAPFNVGIITSLTNVSFVAGSASNPSMYFVGDNQTGFFSPGTGQFTIVSSGSSILNINPSGINVTGIITSSSFVGNLTGTASTATYAISSGIATVSQGLTGTPNIVVGVATITTLNATNSNPTNLNVSGISTLGSIKISSGIVTAVTGVVTYYGDGSSLSGIDATRIVSGLSSITVSSSSTISAYHNGSNIFNVVGTGLTMVAGKRFDVSSYSENVAFLGSVSGTTSLDVGTYSVFVADISGTTSVTFQLSNPVNGRLSSGTLILRFSGTGSRSVSLAMNPKYIGGSGPTYSTTAVTDILSFFTADGGTTTYVTVVGQGFA